MVGRDGDGQIVHVINTGRRLLVGPRGDAVRGVLLPPKGVHGADVGAHVAGAAGGDGAGRLVDDTDTRVAHRPFLERAVVGPGRVGPLLPRGVPFAVPGQAVAAVAAAVPVAPKGGVHATVVAPPAPLRSGCVLSRAIWETAVPRRGGAIGGLTAAGVA